MKIFHVEEIGGGGRHRKWWFSLLAFSYLSSFVAAADELALKPAGKDNFGSGASVSEEMYCPGGIPVVGLFIGNPNSLDRRDRALFRYDLSQFLLAPDQVNKVEFTFCIDRIAGDPSTRKVRVELFSHPLEELNGAAVVSPDVEQVGKVEMKALSSQTLDVTDLIKKDLQQGFSSVTFRIVDGTVEGPNGNTSGPNGICIDPIPSHLPVLKISRDQ